MKKKINISIVGTGLMGLQHIKAISKSKKAKLHSIVDISKNATNLSKKFKIPLYANVEEVLKSKNLDAVIVSTPNQLHEKHTVSFLKKKIPVLLEKPISDNIKSAKKIIVVTDTFKIKITERGIDSSKIDVHKNGVLLDLFEPRPKDKELMDFNPQFEGKKVFAYIGTHGMAHGLSFILNSLPKLQERLPQAHFSRSEIRPCREAWNGAQGRAIMALEGSD